VVQAPQREHRRDEYQPEEVTNCEFEHGETFQPPVYREVSARRNVNARGKRRRGTMGASLCHSQKDVLMKSPYFGSALLLVALFLGLAIGAGWLDQRANAQAGGADAPRFQVSAWGAQVDTGRHQSGCYIVNTQTGELWVASGGGKPAKVVDKLP